jgi:Family of unknown function (DUF6941)
VNQSESPGWDVVMLLCDAAESVGGKLYILGGGWSTLLRPNFPINMALAVKLSVPWHETNRQITLQAELLTEDGEAVEIEGNPVRAEGQMELGRPPGIRPGSSLDAPFVLNFGGVALGPGGYVWQLTVDGQPRARTPFRVLPLSGQPV